MGKLLTLDKARNDCLYRGLDAVEEATAALYYAAVHLAAAGHTKQAQDCKLLHGLGPAA